MSHRSNSYTSPNASGLVRAAVESGRDRGASATPRPEQSSPVRHRPQPPQVVMRSGNENQSTNGSHPNLTQNPLHYSPYPASQGKGQSGFSNHHPNTSQSSIRSVGSQGRLTNGPFGSVIHHVASQNSLRSGGLQNQGVSLNNSNQTRFGNHPNSSGQSSRPVSFQNSGAPPRRIDHSNSGSAEDSEDSDDPSPRFTGRGTTSAMTRSGNALQGPGSNLSQDISVDEATLAFKKRLGSVMKLLSKYPKTEERDNITTHLRAVASEFSDVLRKAKRQVAKLTDETKSLKKQLDSAFEDIGKHEERMHELAAKYQNTIREKDDIQERFQQLSVTSRRKEAEWNATRSEMQEKIDFQTQVVDGKRVLWLDKNPGSSARRDAVNAVRNEADPFGSPTTSRSSRPGTRSNNLGSPTSFTSLESSYGQPPRMAPTGPSSDVAIRREFTPISSQFEKIPTGPARPGPAPAYDYRRGPGAEYGDDEGHPDPNVYSTFRPGEKYDTNPNVRKFQVGIQKVLGLAEGWVKFYTTTPNPTVDPYIGKSNQKIWGFMMECTRPLNLQDSHTHVTALLRDPQTRPWFVMRMIVQYSIDDILSINAWKRFNENVANKLEHVKNRLKQRVGMANEARQMLVDEQTNIVRNIVSNEAYGIFRDGQIEYHSTELRNRLGLLLDENTDRNQSRSGVRAIVANAWDLSEAMNVSRIQFPVNYPDTAGKFVAATMVAKDRQDVDPMQIQIHQTRLKLIISPCITLRDDRGLTIVAKNLVNATVLLMN